MANSVKIEVNGSEKIVTAEVIDKKIWFKIDDQIFSYDRIDLATGNYKKSKNSGKSPDRILAPMPGKVTKVFVSENQSVKIGEALLVMEAMKMEYTLKAEMAGIVEKIFSKVSDQVSLGFLLVQLKENK